MLAPTPTLRRSATGAAVLAAGLLLATPAVAAWQSSGTTTAPARAATLQVPEELTVTCTSGAEEARVDLSWQAGSPYAGHRVRRDAGAATTVPAGTAQHVDHVPASSGATYTWAVTPAVGGWVGTSAATATVTLGPDGGCAP